MAKKTTTKKAATKKSTAAKKTTAKKAATKKTAAKKTTAKKATTKKTTAKKTTAKKAATKKTAAKKTTAKKTVTKKTPATKKTTVKKAATTKKTTAKKSEQVSQGAYPSIIDKRLSQIRFRFQEMKTDGLVVSYLPNIRYLTNFSGSAATLFIFEDELYFFTDDRYEEQIKEELYPIPGLKTFITRDVWQYCKDKKLLKDVKMLAFEGDRVAYSTAVETRNKIRPLKYKPADNEEVERFTVPKAPEELANIEEACRLAEATYKKILRYIKPGVTEKEIANEIAYISRKLGSEKDPFDIIVTSGPRSALVHGTPSDRKIKNGDIVLLDFGCTFNGFVSDISRTVAVGKATKEQKDIYKLLIKAKEAAIAGVHPLMKGMHLDEIARKIIKKAGYGKNFQHALGHGIGLMVHESPRIHSVYQDQIIPEDVVLAIEPGVYIPNKFGMRVEDDIFVTLEGTRKLTNAPEELPVI